MSVILVEILVIVVLVLFNGVLAMSELAVVSARKTRLQQQRDEGNGGARVALELIESPTRFLSTVQIGITLVGVLAGAFGGATIAAAIGDALADVALLAPYAKAIGLGVVVLAITYLSLVLGELVPKRIALQNPERVASLVARPMRVLARLASPAVTFLSASTAAVLRVLRIHDSDEPPITEEEIRLLIDQGTRAGVFATVEQDLVESVFQLDDRHVSAFMTPHLDVVWLDADATPEDIQAAITDSRFSAFPVCDGSLDQPLGIVHAKDLLARCLAGEQPVLTEHLYAPRFVPENIAASRAIYLFKEHETHMLLVIDEHGGIQGVLTEHDLLEAFVGEIPSSGQPDDVRAVQRADGSWLMDGMLHIDEVKERLGVRSFPEAEEGVYETLSGFVMQQIERIPVEGDRFDWGGWTFEVVDMDERRVDKVLVQQSDVASPAAD